MISSSETIEFSGSDPYFEDLNQFQLNSLTSSKKMIACVALGALSGLTLLPSWISLGIGAGLLAMPSVLIKYNKNIKKYFNAAGVIFSQTEPSSIQIPSQKGKCEVISTEHSADTELWRERLIMAAEHNILISGNYCGGNAFIRLLGKIEERIQERPNLQVVILVSPQFITGACKKKFNQLLQAYPDNLSAIYCPSVWHISPGVKKITNHTKCMAIDYGRYFILGGSGIQDSFADTGLDDFTRQDFLREQGVLKENELIHENQSIIERILPRTFRDQDWIFSSYEGKNSAGLQVYKQLLLLAYRWECLNRALKTNDTIAQAAELPVISWRLSSPHENQDSDRFYQSITEKLLDTSAPKYSALSTYLPQFDRESHLVGKGNCQIFFSAPEIPVSLFAKNVIQQINKAKTSILINHMFFHPTTEVMEALVQAAERGVQIKIITCGVYDGAPTSHSIFGPRNKYNYSYLANSISDANRSNISVYEFRGDNKGTHKKLIVIDESTLVIGSSNLGYKSLVTSSDHEINAIVESSEVAKATLAICKIDENHSVQVQTPIPAQNAQELFQVIYHRIFAPLIG